MTPRRIAVATIHRDAPSETFIRAHVARLPAEVHFMTGGHLPTDVSIALTGAISSLPRDLSGAADLGRYLREQRIDLALAEFGPVGAALVPACVAAGVPLVVHFHGYDAYRQDVLEEQAAQYPPLFESAAAVVGVSRAMRAELRRLGAPAERVHCNPCGYDTSLFAPAGDAGEREPVFLATGRLVDKKAPLLTVEAFAAVHHRHPEARLVMAGEGPLDAACRAGVAALGLSGSVVFTGATPHAEVAAAMRRARAFVQHSLTPPSGDREGTPVGILEASGAGLPVVATRHGGIPDIVEDGVTGLLVDEGDVAAMADAMLHLATDGALATRLGQAGHRFVSRSFSLESRVARLWQILCGASEGGPA